MEESRRKFAEAVKWIEEQDTAKARTLREKAKMLVGKLVALETPHPSIWLEVLRIANGFK